MVQSHLEGVIKEKSWVWQVVITGELLQNGLLILNAAGDTFFLIVTGQSGV